MRFFKVLNNQRGFSLIELMVVVAIIGVLAVIAIPQYSQFQRKARQVEAKTILGGIYIAQMAYVAEWRLGSPNLPEIGYDPEGEIIYMAGWHPNIGVRGTNINVIDRVSVPEYRGPLASNVAHTNTHAICNTGGCSIALGSDKLAANPVNNIAISLSKQIGSCSDSSKTSLSACAGTWDHDGASITRVWTNTSVGINNQSPGNVLFTISAIGNLNGTQDDEWIMSQSKILTNVQDGVK